MKKDRCRPTPGRRSVAWREIKRVGESAPHGNALEEVAREHGARRGGRRVDYSRTASDFDGFSEAADLHFDADVGNVPEVNGHAFDVN